MLVRRGLATATPALTHLAEQLLGRKLRGDDANGQHDSVEDASAALALVKMELERLRTDEGPTPPLQPPAVKVGCTGAPLMTDCMAAEYHHEVAANKAGRGMGATIVAILQFTATANHLFPAVLCVAC